ncbi:hypothetical protein [Erysipelothrix urinaevulpis]|uniref:hypothetical protein n=1 Tax=Erysipelothrix urinaevulpis TaxID=2683717 RepID=UPI00135966AF|nr:hypothetical protein [Erysipelothrix urinaevulpis]
MLHLFSNYFALDFKDSNPKSIKNHAPGIVWFIVIAIVFYAIFCTYKGHSFGVIANPLKVGCWK